MSGGDAGLAAAVDQALAEAPPMFVDAEQVELLLGDGPRNRITTQLAVEQVQRSGVGRPKGSPNRRTAKMRDYLASRYRHPLETLAAIQSQPPAILAAELKCTELEAATLIKSAAAELAPYMEGKMPVSVDLTTNGHMTLIMQGGPGLVDAGDLIPEADAVPVLSFAANQALSGDGRSVSE